LPLRFFIFPIQTPKKNAARDEFVSRNTPLP
jgi:hypothetical protein